MPLLLNGSLEGLRTQDIHHYAQLWLIERTDGVSYRFTDHDCPLTFNRLLAQSLTLTPDQPVAGADEVFVPTDSVIPSALQRQSGIKDANVSLTGIITSDQIKDDDLRAGRFREAKVTVFLVDWKWPSAGYFSRQIFYIGAVGYTREFWQAEINAVPAWIKQDQGRVYSNDCDWQLGDNKCKINLATFTASGIVTAIATQRRAFTAGGLTPTTDYYTDGQLTWTAGNNVGLSFDVKSSSGTNVEQQLGTPFDIVVGDTFSIVAGCDHLRGTCVAKFNNIVNFGGFPYLPGNDVLIRAPL